MKVYIGNSFCITLCLCVISMLCSCGSGSGSGGGGGTSNSPIAVQSIPLYANGLNGSGNIIVASYTDNTSSGSYSGFKETLKIYQQDSTNPDLLLDLGSVYLGVDTLYHRLADITLNSQWATITINYNESSQGWVALVPLSGHPNYSLSATLAFNTTLDRAVAIGNWLLVASNSDLSLYDISTPTSPILRKSFTLNSTTTSMLALSNGFFVITNNGYGYLNASDPMNITFVETASADIKQSKKAYLIGNNMFIGGPSKYAGKVKMARINVSTPSAPIVESINDHIDGTFVDFSYDNVDGYYLQTNDSIQLYKETTGNLALYRAVSLPSYVNSSSQLYAYNSRFYVGKWSMNVYKMP